LQVTLCDPYLRALSVKYYNKGAYINPLLLPLPFKDAFSSQAQVTKPNSSLNTSSNTTHNTDPDPNHYSQLIRLSTSAFTSG